MSPKFLTQDRSSLVTVLTIASLWSASVLLIGGFLILLQNLLAPRLDFMLLVLVIWEVLVVSFVWLLLRKMFVKAVALTGIYCFSILILGLLVLPSYVTTSHTFLLAGILAIPPLPLICVLLLLMIYGFRGGAFQKSDKKLLLLNIAMFLTVIAVLLVKGFQIS